MSPSEVDDQVLADGSFAEQLQAWVDVACADPAGRLSRREGLTQVMTGYLEDAGVLDGADPCDYSLRGLEVAAASLDDEGDSIDLIATIPKAQCPPAPVTKAESEAVLRRLREFARRSLAGELHGTLPPGSAARDVAHRIFELGTSVGQVRFFLLTDGRFTNARLSVEPIDSTHVSLHLWDAVRLERALTSGIAHEPITVDFTEMLGHPLPCLAAPGGLQGDFESYLLLLPAVVLADLYQEYGPRLMELNVRSFLQARGKVNRGIRDTLRQEPQRFLAYNNGLAATADHVEIETVAGRSLAVRAVTDLQIVNGGQTTASIYWARRRDGVDLSHVGVQMKLTEVSRERVQEIVPLISRYSNSQNAVSLADFKANDAMQVALEKVSRTLLAPAAPGSQIETHWFYERARGQYEVAIGQLRTLAEQKKFKLQNPVGQRITKIELARYENIWALLPHTVSLGAQKNFREFMLVTERAWDESAVETYFRLLVAKALVVRAADKLVAKQKLGGYRANTVAYTLALILHRANGQLDLERVWRQQRVGNGMERAIETVSPVVHAELIRTAGQRNVTEWAKQKDCWDAIRRLVVRLPEALDDELIPRRRVGSAPAMAPADATLLRAVRTVGSEGWLALASWLDGRDRSEDARSARLLAAQTRNSSVQLRQGEQGMALLKAAIESGYRPDGSAAVARVRTPVQPAAVAAPSDAVAARAVGQLMTRLAAAVSGAEVGSTQRIEAEAERQRLLDQMGRLSSVEVAELWGLELGETSPAPTGDEADDVEEAATDLRADALAGTDASPAPETGQAVGDHVLPSGFSEYTEWEPSGPVVLGGMDLLANLIREVVAIEQPVTVRRVTEVLVNATPELSGQGGFADEMNRAVDHGNGAGLFEADGQLPDDPADLRVLSIPGQGSTRIRVAGPRSAAQIPIDELWAEARRIFAETRKEKLTLRGLRNRLLHRFELPEDDHFLGRLQQIYEYETAQIRRDRQSAG